MSSISNWILSFSGLETLGVEDFRGEEPPFVVRQVNNALQDAYEAWEKDTSQESICQNRPWFNLVDRYAGGSYAFEATVAMAAINHADIPRIVDIIKGMNWRCPEEFQLFVKDQEATWFSLYTIVR
ncbi:MAG: hypothetical protein GY937_20035 [bacterium]|nr:hypothetical protein [bacterium]